MINICFSSDNNYIKHLTVAIASILKNANETDTLYFYILDGGISSENKNKILELTKIKSFNITYIEMDYSIFKKMPNYSSYISMATYFRFMISTLLPNVNKIIYMDCDIVVCESLKELFEEDISKYAIAGIEDIGYYYHRRLLKREVYSFYINAGVILMNLDMWRKNNIENQLFNFVKNSKEKLVHNDQDILNMVLNTTSKALDLKWNVQDSFFRVCKNMEYHYLKKSIIKAVKNPGIIHYTGVLKPWNNPYIDGAELYFKYLQNTPFNFKPSFEFKTKKKLKRIIYIIRQYKTMIRFILSSIVKTIIKKDTI